MRIIPKKLLYIIGLCIAASLYASAPTQLKETYRCFAPSYEHLSPLHGALLWESGTIRNYYDASSHIKAPTNQWLPKVDGPLRLTHALFTDTQGNFDISHNPNYPARHLGISTLGNIIVLLEKKDPLDALTLENFIIKDPEFSSSIDSVNLEHDETEKHFDKLSDQPEAPLQTSLIPYSKNFALNKLKMQRLHKDWTRTQKLALINTKITEIDQLTGKAKNRAQQEHAQLIKQRDRLQAATGTGDYNRIRELAQAIIDANAPSSFFPDNIAKWLLLACMYRKAKNKTELMPYFSVLKQHIPHACSILEESCMQKLFTPADFKTIPSRMVSILEGTPGILDSSTYETLAAAQMIERYYKGPFPKIAEYTDIVVNGVSFPDCVEVTLMNLCDRVTYNKTSGTFELERISTERRSQLLIDFYTDLTNKQSTNIHLPSVHQQWGTPLQDLPFITYRQRIMPTVDGKTIVLSAPKDTNGFIYGLSPDILATLPHKKDKKDYVQIAGRWYIHSPEPHGYLCEMHPTIRNIIIAFDTLFNLNFFADKPLAEAFLSENFNANYFPHLCTNFPILQHNNWTAETLESFDRDEYTDRGIRIAFEYFDLILTDEHAEIIANTQGSSLGNIAPTLLKLSALVKDNGQKWRLAQLASIFPFDIEHIIGKEAYPYLLYLPLYNNQIKIHAAAYCIHKMREQALPEQDANHFAQLAISCIRHLPERADWHYHIELIEMLTPEQLQHPIVQAEITRIITIAHDRLKKESSDCEYVPALYACLIAKNQPLGSVMNIIDNILARTDEFDRKPLLNLLILLAKKGNTIPQAHRAVEICIHNSVEAENKLAQQLKASISLLES
jgi:hypothetical protein